MDGRTLNRRWNVGVKHALYSKTGNWYHPLQSFPAALFDLQGYVVFETEAEYRSCVQININQDIWVPHSISSLPSYVRVIIDGKEYVPPTAQASFSRENRVHYEGNPVSVNLTQYERDRRARDECLDHYGHLCCVCNFDFGKTYGEIARGMIHVHHLIPIATPGESHLIDPVRDLRPICPNCHAVIHKRQPPFSIDEVKMMINVAMAAR